MAPVIKVIAYGMHEPEIAAARNLLKNPQATEAFVVGDIDEAAIPQLENAGLIVQRLADKTSPARQPITPGSFTDTIPSAAPRVTTFATHHVQVRAAEELPDTNEPAVYLIQIAGPLLEDFRARLSAMGVRLMESYGGDYYSAYLMPEQVGNVSNLSFVENVKLYTGDMSAPPVVSGVTPLAPATVGSTPMLTYDIRLHRESDLQTVLNWCKQRNIAVAGSSRRKIRIYLLQNSPLFSDIANLTAVERIEEYVAPRLWNDHARVLLKVIDPTGTTIGLDGANQIIGIADTGIDDNHPDFANAFAHIFPRGRPGVSDDPHGHGTHVAGSAAARGSAFPGAAPAARIVFQALLDSSGRLGGLPLDLNDLFDEAYQAGARIHNNSWGSATAATYTLNSSEVDEFVWNHPDFFIVIAAGNEGQAANCRNTSQGIVDWLSVGSPATSKNAITVGASRSDRNSGGLSTSTPGAQWPANFPCPPEATETISGDPQSIAAFSSRGPSDDRRIKPDLVAPGTDIVSARSSKAPTSTFWGLHQNPQYAYLGGTSMAAPFVSGCAALVRQYYAQQRDYDDPSAALLRATLINGTRWLTGRSALESNGVLGNYDQGFGFVDMTATVPCPLNSLSLSYVDSWKTPGMGVAVTGERRRWLVNLKTKGTLRVCLAYTDYPARGLQNNLNLLVQAPNQKKTVGNEGIRQALKTLDVDNNVEIVRIEDADPGNYWIQVTASNLLHTPQEFAVVVTGPLGGQLTSA